MFTFGMAFTGQLLRWNQDAYWAVVVGAAQAARAPLIGDLLAGILFAGQDGGRRHADPLLRHARVHDPGDHLRAARRCTCTWSFATACPSRRCPAWSSTDRPTASATRS